MTATPPRRLTREEQRAKTRDDLLTAARHVFAARGYHAASVDDVAEAAGYTKGAVYSNFSSKEELFLSIIDQHIDEATAAIDEVFAQAAPQDRVRQLRDRPEVRQVFDPDWLLLELEFALYAARNPEIRKRHAERQRDTRERIGERVARLFEDLGVEPPLPPESVARLLLATGDGLGIQQLSEEDEVDAQQLYSDFLDFLMAAATRPS